MKQKVLGMMSGALVCLSLVFSSCGNIDNPLEEIVNSNPQVAVLAGALEDNAEVTADFRTCGDMLAYLADMSNRRNSRTRAVGPDLSGYIDPETGEMPIQVVFKNQGGEFILKSFKINGLDVDDNAETIAQEFSLDYKKVDNKLLLSICGYEDAYMSESKPKLVPLTTIVFDLSDNSYAQYVYPNVTYVVLDKISVNSEDKTYLIENKYKEQTIFSIPFGGGLGTRGYAIVEASGRPSFMKMFCVFYKDGETWAEVNERYKKEAGSPLLVAFSDLDEDDQAEFNNIVDAQKMAFLNYYRNSSTPFAYNEDNVDESSFVKTNEKVGYKADGETANPDGYLANLMLIRRLVVDVIGRVD